MEWFNHAQYAENSLEVQFNKCHSKVIHSNRAFITRLYQLWSSKHGPGIGNFCYELLVQLTTSFYFTEQFALLCEMDQNNVYTGSKVV